MKNFNHKLLFFIFSTLCCVVFSFFIFSKAEAFTFVSEDITEDTIWNLASSPYIIENTINILHERTLTIEPGVVVKFDPLTNPSIYVLGNLIANGNENNKIYFTSNYDDSVGGNTNEDLFCYDDFDEEGNYIGEICEDLGLPPFVSDWEGIIFINSSDSFLKYSVFKYADQALELDSSNINIENIEINNSNAGILIYEYSNSTIVGGIFHNIFKDVLLAYNDSSISALNINIKNISQDAITIFNNSSLDISNSSIKDVFNGDTIVIFNNSYLNLQNLSMKDIFGQNASIFTIFNNSHLHIKNSYFENCPSGSCVVVFDGELYLLTPSDVLVENSIFNGGLGPGFLSFGDSDISINISGSIIKNFLGFAIKNFTDYIVNAKNNFWGNSTGPFHSDLNPQGTAGFVSNNVDFIPWCQSFQDCNLKNPVILIPGIMGTKLLKDSISSEEIWPNINDLIFSISDDFLNYLSLNVDGVENSNNPVKIGDIIRSININILGLTYTSHVFDGLIEALKEDGYIEDVNLFVFPYDWRKSSRENAAKLNSKIEQILAQTSSEKVDLIAHSMGGLLAKKYLAWNNSNKVDDLIFIGTPHLGAPKAFKALMYGDDMGMKIGFLSILSPARVKSISQNMPSVFELLPSKKYVDGQENFIGEKYVTNLIKGPNPIINPDLDYNQTKDFMIDQGRNELMFSFAENLHNDIDNLDLNNVNVTNFSGCGITKTISHFTIQKKENPFPWGGSGESIELGYTNGDETVPLHSSILSMSTQYYVKDFSHSELPSASGLKETIISILKNEIPLNFPNISSDIDDCYISGKMFGFFGSGEVHVYDSEKKHTGLNNDGVMEFGILGVQYDEILNNKFVFLPDSQNYQIKIKIDDIGDHNFFIKNIEKDDKETDIVYWDNAFLEKSEVNYNINVNNLLSNLVLEKDKNNDGIFEEKILPKIFNIKEVY